MAQRIFPACRGRLRNFWRPIGWRRTAWCILFCRTWRRHPRSIDGPGQQIHRRRKHLERCSHCAAGRGRDKEWLAVGPDPASKNRDNVYVTWTSFQSTACELRFGRSTDGGATWTAKTIFVPTADPDPTHPQNCLQFSNPVVDQIKGTLYVPFLHFSNADQDFIQMLISDDAGETFRFAMFNIPGAPDSTVMPVTQPGELTQCGPGNFRLTIHD